MNSRVLRLIALASFIAVGVSGLNEKAFADSGPWMRWKQGHRDEKVIRHDQRSGGVVYVHENGAGPALAGFIGGLVLGSAIHSQPVMHERLYVAPPPCPRPYDYYDPYSDQSYRSFESCAEGMRYANHPRVIRVIEVSSGDCVDTYRWCDGDWHTSAWFENRGRHRGWERHDHDENDHRD